MRNRLGTLWACMLAVTVLLGGAAVPAQTAAEKPAAPADAKAAKLDLSKVTDPKAKAALEQLQSKEQNIKELIIGEMKIQMVTPQGMVDSTMELMTREPDMMRMEGKTSTGMPGGEMEMTMVSDGKTLWQSIQSPQGPMVMKADLEKVKAAGGDTDMFNASASMLDVFKSVDPASIKLERETPEAWVFFGKMEMPAGMMMGGGGEATTQTLTVSKQTGLPQRVEMGNGMTMTLDKVQVNPQPPITDEKFQYSPPEGVQVRDITDQLVQMAQMMKAAKEGQANGQTPAPPAQPAQP